MPVSKQFGDTAQPSVLVFPGQGTQHIGMGTDVCDQLPETAAIWDCASDIAAFDVRRMCAKGPLPKLDKTGFQQVAVTTVNIATLTALRLQDPLPVAAVAGHSVGEFSALYAAGVLGLEDVFRGVSARGQIMQALAEESDGAMYAIKGVGHAVIRDFIASQGMQDRVQVANDNSPRQQVISGARDALRELLPFLLKSGFEHVRLPVNGAWHSHLMRAGDVDFRAVLDSLAFALPQVPVYTNQTADVLVEPDAIRDDLARNLYSTVRWRETMLRLAENRCQALLEVGPKRVLGRMLQDYTEPCLPFKARHADDLTGAACGATA